MSIEQSTMRKELIRDIIQWDVKSWSKALAYWEHNVDWSGVEHCLELGGQQGGLSLWLALKGKRVICSDLKNVRINAQQLHARYPVGDLISYQDIDATAIPYENFFDIIVFKSIIGGIGRDNNYEMQQQVFKEIYKALKPGGVLLFAENLIASPFHQQLRKKFINWGDSWRYLSIQEITACLNQFSSYTIKTTGLLGAVGRNENQRSFLAGIDNIILNNICPPSWKYIAYGIAKK